MGYPDDYPDDLKESIFAWNHEGEAGGTGDQTFVLTRNGGKLNVYVLQYLGHLNEAPGRDGGRGGDVMLPADTGTIADPHYNPRAEENFLPADMLWHGERPRLSQPVRRWLRKRDYVTADRDTLLAMIAEQENFDLSAAWL